jgi:predicted MPP superfamily phosphohydrolase
MVSGVDSGKKVDNVSHISRNVYNNFSKGDKKMIKALNKAKPVFIVVVLGILLSTTSVISSAEASTIKNGVSCKKSGLKAKSGVKRYVCGKNPYVNPTRLTWMLTSCPEANDLYTEAKDQYGIFKDILSSSPEGLTELANLQKSMDSLEVLMKTKVCRRGA